MKGKSRSDRRTLLYAKQATITGNSTVSWMIMQYYRKYVSATTTSSIDDVRNIVSHAMMSRRTVNVTPLTF